MPRHEDTRGPRCTRGHEGISTDPLVSRIYGWCSVPATRLLSSFANILAGVSATAVGLLIATGLRLLRPYRRRVTALLFVVLVSAWRSAATVARHPIYFGAELCQCRVNPDPFGSFSPIKSWPTLVASGLVQVVRRRDRRAAERPPRVRRCAAPGIPVGPPGQAVHSPAAAAVCMAIGAFSKPARRLSLSR